jgi:hypothetical protein
VEVDLINIRYHLIALGRILRSHRAGTLGFHFKTRVRITARRLHPAARNAPGRDKGSHNIVYKRPNFQLSLPLYCHHLTIWDFDTSSLLFLTATLTYKSLNSVLSLMLIVVATFEVT